MNIQEAKKQREIINNELTYLYEKKQMAFESTQPKAIQISDISVQSSHKNRMYEKLDYSIDEIEPRIKELETQLKILNKYIDNYYNILEKYDPTLKKIIILREEKKLSWEKISQQCYYSERMCRYKYDYYKKGIQNENRCTLGL